MDPVVLSLTIVRAAEEKIEMTHCQVLDGRTKDELCSLYVQ
jgi:hypothetical protein